MPILDLQKRLHETGRIRIGEKVWAKNRKGEDVQRPAKLSKFRFTSANAHAIDEVAAQWGGTPKDWDSPNGLQREVYTDAQSIDVLLPPGEMAFSQWREVWSAGGCQKRCDGVYDVKRDCPCDCDPERRECKDTTRLSVVLPDLPGVGLWRIESHGYYAAVELDGVTSTLATIAPGALIPCRLWLDERSDKVTVNGKTQTRRWIVPVLDPRGRLSELAAGPHAAVALAAPIPENGNGLTPVPAGLPAAPAPAIGAQVTAVNTPAARKARANSQEPLPPTGLEPGPAPPGSSGRGSDDRVPPAPGEAASPARASKDERDVIRSLGEQLDEEGRKAVKAWRAEHGIPAMSSPDLTSVQAALFMEAIEAVLAGGPPPDGDGSGGGGVPVGHGGPVPSDPSAVEHGPDGGAPAAGSPGGGDEGSAHESDAAGPFPGSAPSGAPSGVPVALKDVDEAAYKRANRRIRGLAHGSKGSKANPPRAGVLDGDQADVDAQLHALVWCESNGRVRRLRDASGAELAGVEARLVAIGRGVYEMHVSDTWPDGWEVAVGPKAGPVGGRAA